MKLTLFQIQMIFAILLIDQRELFEKENNNMSPTLNATFTSCIHVNFRFSNVKSGVIVKQVTYQ